MPPADGPAPTAARPSAGRRSSRTVPSRGCPSRRPPGLQARRWGSNADLGHPSPLTDYDTPTAPLGIDRLGGVGSDNPHSACSHLNWATANGGGGHRALRSVIAQAGPLLADTHG